MDWVGRSTTRLRDDRGAGIVEYSLLLVFLAIAAVGAISQVGGSVEETFEDVNADIHVITDCATWRTAWWEHRDELIEHRNAGTWSGAAHRDTRIEWVADRDELRATRTDLGC